MKHFDIPEKAFKDHFIAFLYATSIINDDEDVTKLTFDKLVDADGTIPISIETETKKETIN